MVSDGDLGTQAVELAARAGLVLDGWQENVLRASLERRSDGLWRHWEVSTILPRQNGKNAIIEARELAGLFLLGEDLIIHSAHEFATSLEAFRRLLDLIENTPDLDRLVSKVAHSHGDEGIELKTGQRIRYRTRTKGGGRGFSCDLLILDEAMAIQEFAYGALLPTLSARPNPQIWYTGSAVDQTVHEHGVVLARIRERGLKGDSDLAYCEYAAPMDLDEVVGNPELLNDPALWAQANPALNTRISPEHVGRELLSLHPRTFAVERLGVGDWPVTDPLASSLIDADLWKSLADPLSSVLDPLILAFDVTPDRGMAAIAIAGRRADNLLHVEVIEHRQGTAWVAARVAQLVADHRVTAVRCDAAGPAASLLPDLAALGVAVQPVTAQEHAQACGSFFDAVTQRTLRHLGTAELAGAVAGAATRTLGESWAWARKKSSVDISPLVAVTVAAWNSAPVAAQPFFFARA